VQGVNNSGNVIQMTSVIPNTAPYQVQTARGVLAEYLRNPSATVVLTGYVPTGSLTPAAGQYHCNTSTGVYTFNASAAGQVVSISYASANQAAQYAALPYNGIAHVDCLGLPARQFAAVAES
jgi:hypothetical protein